MRAVRVALLAFCPMLLSGTARATYSIAAADTATKQVGGAVTSCVGSLDLAIVYGGLPGHGVVHVQAQLDPSSKGKTAAVQLLGQGAAPVDIIAMIASAPFDANFDVRQYGIVDVTGRAAGFTGAKARVYKEDRQGQSGPLVYSVQGNILKGKAVLDQAEAAFRGVAGCDLADRLMLALEAGALNGEGDSRCTPAGIPADSAFIEVDEATGSPGGFLKLSVTSTSPESAVVRLRAQYDDWRRRHPCPVVLVDSGANGDGGSGHMGAGACEVGPRRPSSNWVVWLIGVIVGGFVVRRRRILSLFCVLAAAAPALADESTPADPSCPVGALERELAALPDTAAAMEKIAAGWPARIAGRAPACREQLFKAFWRHRAQSGQRIADQYENLDEAQRITLDRELARAGWSVRRGEAGTGLVEDGRWLARRFGPSLPPPWTAYLAQRTMDMRQGLSEDAALLLSWNELGARLRFWEDFAAANPRFAEIDSIRDYVDTYIAIFLRGINNSRIEEDGAVKREVRAAWQKYLAVGRKAPHYAVVKGCFDLLKKNGWKTGGAGVEEYLERNHVRSLLGVEPPWY